MYGIEMDDAKCKKAVALVQRTVNVLAQEGITITSHFKFIKEYIAKVDECCACVCVCVRHRLLDPACHAQVHSLEPATHIYCCWEGFARGDMEWIGKLFQESRTAYAVTIVQRSFR